MSFTFSSNGFDSMGMMTMQSDNAWSFLALLDVFGNKQISDELGKPCYWKMNQLT